MKRLRNVKDKMMEDVLRQNFLANDCYSDLCNRCTEKWIHEDSIQDKSRSRSASPKLETRIKTEETQDTTYRNISNIREEPTTKVDRLLREAVGWDTETATHDDDNADKGHFGGPGDHDTPDEQRETGAALEADPRTRQEKVQPADDADPQRRSQGRRGLGSRRSSQPKRRQRICKG